VCALIARVTGLGGAALLLHAEAGRALATVPVPASGELLLVVGPEGGLTEGELTVFRAAGAKAVRLGPSILRTSTAGAAALAVLSVRAGRWT
jgi:16S rRNA (uracil1498-N3)-methyltransferase